MLSAGGVRGCSLLGGVRGCSLLGGVRGAQCWVCVGVLSAGCEGVLSVGVCEGCG